MRESEGESLLLPDWIALDYFKLNCLCVVWREKERVVELHKYGCSIFIVRFEGLVNSERFRKLEVNTSTSAT